MFVVEPVVHRMAHIMALGAIVEVQRCILSWTYFIRFPRKSFALGVLARLHG